jgi:hypothetical protein
MESYSSHEEHFSSNYEGDIKRYLGFFPFAQVHVERERE